MPLYAPPGIGLLKVTNGVPSIAGAGDVPAHTHTLSEITDAGDLAAEDFPGGTNFLRADGTWAAGGGGISLDDVFDLFYPVGRIVEFAANVDPNTAFARGTWVLHGVGRVTVCIDTGQTEFDTVDETGGTKTHTLTTAEMPSHTHTQRVMSAASGGLSGVVRDTSSNNVVDDAQQTGATGGGGSHNNLQPYIVTYRWERTA